MPHHALQDILLLLALSVLAVAALRRVHLPPILGYLLVGVMAGPFGLGFVEDSEALHFLGEIGVVFLLFTIGLEFSVPQFLTMRGTVLGLGGSQVVLATVAGAGLAMLHGLDGASAMVFGGVLALSSTALVVKQLTDQMELQSRHGRVALGILLFQDLAVVPFLVAIPILAGDSGNGLAGPLAAALLKGTLAFVGVFVLGRWGLRPLFHEVGRARSAELFTLSALMVALAAAWLTDQLGLSLALGAFLGGLMLGETEYRHQVEVDIRPFRDVLLGLFFITIGARLDPSAIVDHWAWVAELVAVLLLGKALLITALVRFGRHEGGVALRTGLVLGQGGEFGFALLALAMSHELFGPAVNQALLGGVVLSMAVTPFVIRFNGRMAKLLLAGSYGQGRAERERALREAASGLSGHIIIAGYGRVGQNLGKFLRDENLPFVALDLDPVRITEARNAGEDVFFGDATHGAILAAAGLERARAVVVSFDEATASERLVRRVRESHPDLPVLVRTRDDSYLEPLKAAGASKVLPESLESSLMLATELLLWLDVPMSEVMRLLENARASGYQTLRGVYAGSKLAEASEAEKAGPTQRVHTVVLSENAYAAGRSLDVLGLEKGGVAVVAVRRSGVRGEEPAPDLVLRPGDGVVLQGASEVLEWAEKRLLSG